MHTIDLSKKDIRTDLVIDEIENYNSKVIKEEKSAKLEEVKIDKNNKTTKKEGLYETITFQDITDKDNFKAVENLGIQGLKRLLEEYNIKKEDSVLVIGLGNASSTPDALGPKTIEQVLVTRHLFSMGEVEEGYRNVSCLTPSVTGKTGIETKDVIDGIKEKVNPNLIIVIDALASNSLDRLNKTIQMTSSGIAPGSGVGNNRLEISKNTLNIPVIAIGVPTVVDATTIVKDTLQLLLKQISYLLNNKDQEKLKLIPIQNRNYQDETKELSQEQKEDVLGMVGLLTEEELKSLLLEVLLPVNQNMIVTPKEIDYLIEKLGLLLGNIINKSLHEHFNPTN